MKIIIALLSILLVGAVALCCVLYLDQPKIGFVDTAYLYNNFAMKKELEKKLMDISHEKQAAMDSLYERIARNPDRRDGQETGQLQQQYSAKRESAEKEMEQLHAAYEQQIWKQINALVSQFGTEHKLPLILGANGDGAIMHGDKALNLSEEVLRYMNSNYNGK